MDRKKRLHNSQDIKNYGKTELLPKWSRLDLDLLLDLDLDIYTIPETKTDLDLGMSSSRLSSRLDLDLRNKFCKIYDLMSGETIAEF